MFELTRYSRGSASTVINGLSASSTSSEISCEGFNSLLVDLDVTSAGTVSVTLKGCPVTGGTFKSVYNPSGVLQTITATTVSLITTFTPITPYCKIAVTVTGTPTHTITVTPVNL
jgi:hypothetical protein